MIFIISHKSIKPTNRWYFVVGATSPLQAYWRLRNYIKAEYDIAYTDEQIMDKFSIIGARMELGVIELRSGDNEVP